ncbi:MAG: hypothetical protein K2K55_08420 [Duncaniella sp.]|nr:hypothetical protein [Duncaniella sp.]
MKKWLVVLTRVVIGVVFILSGGAKCIDPWGTVFKIEEYFAVWGWYDFPASLITVGAFLLAGYEFVWGGLLMLGCYRRGAVVALSLLMAFMLPLSLYIAIADPVADCGCFGDALVISNTATFIKNLFICAGLAYLLPFNRRVATFVTPYVQWIAGGWLTLYALGIGLIGYNLQPLMDFRRFSPGVSLFVSDEETDNGEIVTQMVYTYERDGVRRDFTLTNLPDSTWTFVDSHIEGGNETITDGFVITDPETGEDLTEEVLSTAGGKDLFIVTIPDIKQVDLSATYLLNDLNDFILSRNGKLVVLTGINATAADISAWRDVSMGTYPIYRTDEKQIKELARGNSALVYVEDGEVRWKRTLNSISYSLVTDTPADELLEQLDPTPVRMFQSVTLFFAGFLALLIILDRTGHLVHISIKRRKRKSKDSCKETEKSE